MTGRDCPAVTCRQLCTPRSCICPPCHCEACELRSERGRWLLEIRAMRGEQ